MSTQAQQTNDDFLEKFDESLTRLQGAQTNITGNVAKNKQFNQGLISKLKDLNKQITNINASITVLIKTIDELKNKHTSISTDINTHKDEITQLKKQIALLENKKSELDKQLNALKADKLVLEQTQTDLKSEVTKLTGRLDSAEKEQAQLQLLAEKTGNDAVKKAAQDLEALGKQYDTSLNALRDEIAEKEKGILSLKNEIESNKIAVASHQSEVATLTNKNAVLVDKIKEATNVINTTQQALNQLSLDGDDGNINIEIEEIQKILNQITNAIQAELPTVPTQGQGQQQNTSSSSSMSSFKKQSSTAINEQSQITIGSKTMTFSALKAELFSASNGNTNSKFAIALNEIEQTPMITKDQVSEILTRNSISTNKKSELKGGRKTKKLRRGAKKNNRTKKNKRGGFLYNKNSKRKSVGSVSKSKTLKKTSTR